MEVPLWDVHPRFLRLLERVEFPMQLHRGDGPSILFVDLLFAREAPVVGESGGSCMLFAVRDLLLVEVQFGAVAPVEQHRVSLLMPV